MKSKLILLLFLFLTKLSTSQIIYDTTTLRTRVNQWIAPNFQRAITANQMNLIFNGLLNTRKVGQLQYGDTSSMLNPYANKTHVVKYHDTASMLIPYAVKTNVVRYHDTANILLPYTRLQRMFDSVMNLRTLINQKASIASLSNYYPLSGGTLNGSVSLVGGGVINFYTSSTYRSTLGIGQGDAVGYYNRPFFFGGPLFRFQVNGGTVVAINEDGSVNASSYTGSWSGNTIASNRLDLSSRVAYTDTSSFLAAYTRAQRFLDTAASLRSLANSKGGGGLSYSDTTTFLSNVVKTYSNQSIWGVKTFMHGISATTANITTSNVLNETVSGTLYAPTIHLNGAYSGMVINELASLYLKYGTNPTSSRSVLQNVVSGGLPTDTLLLGSDNLRIDGETISFRGTNKRIFVPNLWFKTLAVTDGTGANGTWPISVTGNASTVTGGIYSSDTSSMLSAYIRNNRFLDTAASLRSLANSKGGGGSSPITVVCASDTGSTATNSPAALWAPTVNLTSNGQFAKYEYVVLLDGSGTSETGTLYFFNSSYSNRAIEFVFGNQSYRTAIKFDVTVVRVSSTTVKVTATAYQDGQTVYLSRVHQTVSNLDSNPLPFSLGGETSNVSITLVGDSQLITVYTGAACAGT